MYLLNTLFIMNNKLSILNLVLKRLKAIDKSVIDFEYINNNKKINAKFIAILIFLLMLFSLNLLSEIFYKGNDASFIDELIHKGAIYKENNKKTNPLHIYKEHGMNTIRLRIWNNPKNGYCNLERTLFIAKEIKENNLFFILNFHFSDTWADPSQQIVPEKWKHNSFKEIKTNLFNYSFKVINALKQQNTLPEIIQIGNEIENGILFPHGSIQNINQFTQLLNASIKGVKRALTENELKNIKIMIHISPGGDKDRCYWFFNQIISHNINFDIIGLSYYPWWHGSFFNLKENMNNLAKQFNKDIMIVETAYPWTLDWFDYKHNVVGEQSQLLHCYPATVQGQKRFISTLIRKVKDVPKNRGKGVIYWAADYISIPEKNSSWENMTLFDFNGNLLDSINAFK